MPWGREKFRPRYPLVPRMTAGQQAAIVASAQDWAKAQTVGNPQFKENDQKCNLALLVTSEQRAAESGASLRTQKMADKVAKADPDLAKQVAHGEKTLPKAVEELTGRRPGAKPKPVVSDELAEVRAENERLSVILPVTLFLSGWPSPVPPTRLRSHHACCAEFASNHRSNDKGRA